MKKLFIFTFLAFFYAAAFYSEGEVGITEKKKVLFLSSYSMKEEAVMLQIYGLTSILPDDKYEISYEFMDARRFNTSSPRGVSAFCSCASLKRFIARV